MFTGSLRATFVATLLVASGCVSGSNSAATILVDFSHDEFATQFIRYFPDRVQVHPGDTVTFRQTWTGEPHTVTLGGLVQDMLGVVRPLIEEYGDRPESEVPPAILETYYEATCSVRTMECDEEAEPTEEPAADEGEVVSDVLDQVIAQPCLVVDGDLPPGPGPCEVRDLPAFAGTESYYNSGIIPYEGPGENVFELKLSEEISPGEYGFYCAVHGPFQAGVIEVVPEDREIPPPADVSARTRREVNEALEPFRTAFEAAQREGTFVYGGETFAGNFSGLVPAGDTGLLNEFVPKELDVNVGEPVTWLMFGPHSISFDVPEYFPIVEFGQDGTVSFNEAVWLPAGGAPEVPEPDGPPGIEGDGGPPPSVVVDGGTYDGSGFWSTGVLYSDSHVEYTLRFSTPGTYEYACLIHPPMVGTVRVNE